jgi:hypothetical protein
MDLEKQKAKYKRYYTSHKKQVNEKCKKYRNKNKEHVSDYNADYHNQNRDKINLRNKEQAKVRRREHPEKRMLVDARKRSKKAGSPFNLELSDIVIPKRCPILNIPLQVSEGQPSDGSPSIDKIIPELGYVKNNVQVISYRANTIKNCASLDELIAIGKWAKRQSKK